jgi:hypothetical protein
VVSGQSLVVWRCSVLVDQAWMYGGVEPVGAGCGGLQGICGHGLGVSQETECWATARQGRQSNQNLIDRIHLEEEKLSS